MTASEIINKIIDYSKLTPAQFATKIQAKTTQAIYDLQSGRTKSISTEMGKKILSCYPEISKIWLLTGEGDMLTTITNTDEKQETYLTYLLPMSALGGDLTGFSSSALLSDCEKIVSPIANIDFAITIHGDSMSPEYPSGSMVLIKKIDHSLFIDWGKVHVIDTPNGVIIKQVKPSKKEGYISCYSINPDYAPFEVELSKIYGIYRVLMCLSAK